MAVWTLAPARLHAGSDGFCASLTSCTAGALSWSRRTLRPEKQVIWLTRLLLCLVTIEFVDIIFAFDSVPAVFSLTQEPFIVYTSNIFAILGLRSLYFMLSAVVHRFQVLNYALAVVLVFIGGEIFLRPWMEDIPAWVSLIATIAILASGVLFSLWRTRHMPSVELSTVPENAEAPRTYTDDPWRAPV